jgi:adenylate cyclase
MFTDIVGFTTLGQKNESLALALLEEHRKLTRSILKKHHGREVKTIGDAFLLEFASALGAVTFAYEIQKATFENNQSSPDDQKLHVRIGVHLGDIVDSKGDISGDAVNVASRIEAFAEDGGVCITRHVYDHVRNKLDLKFSNLGPKSLKNVLSPLEVFRLDSPWEEKQREEEGEEESNNFPTYRLAVLPFVSISPKPSDEYFADGLTEELIDSFTQLGLFEVIARTTIMNYKKKEKNVSEIARELKVGSVVEGSVRKSGNKIRVTAQLINCNTEAHLWSSCFDAELKDIFKVQRDIAGKVVGPVREKLWKMNLVYSGSMTNS